MNVNHGEKRKMSQCAKMQIKYKALEVSYEGEQSFIESGLVDLCKGIVAIDVPEAPISIVQEEKALQASGLSKKSTADFAVSLSASSGPDLVIAACAFLHFTEGKEELKRAEILDAMKSAKSFYKASYGGNLSSCLAGLVKKERLRNPGNEVYALTHSELQALKTNVD